MILRRSSILLNVLPSNASGTIQSSTSSRTSTRQPSCHAYVIHEPRFYATIAGGEDQGGSCKAKHSWPPPAKGQKCPTPYQIFDLKHHEEYSKARFYELVKIYHPDVKNGATDDDATQTSLRIERYRLLVAAHTILSDPIKRSAYDRFGAGWDGKREIGEDAPWSATSSKHQPGPFSHSWSESGPHDDTIWRNATWEDWERWHERKAGHEARAPLYMKNTYFVAMVAALAMVGGSLNYGRAQDAGAYFIEQRDLVHDRAAKDLRRVRQEKQSIDSRQDRIDFFVRQREATMGLAAYDVEAEREERANRLLRDKEICRSEEIKERDGG